MPCANSLREAALAASAVSEAETSALLPYLAEIPRWRKHAVKQLPQHAAPDDYVLLLNHRVTLTQQQAYAMKDALDEVTAPYLPQALERHHSRSEVLTRIIDSGADMSPPSGPNADAEIAKQTHVIGQGAHSHRGDDAEHYDASQRTAMAALTTMFDHCNGVADPEADAAVQMSLTASASKMCRHYAARHYIATPERGSEKLTLQCTMDAMTLTEAMPDQLMDPADADALTERDNDAVRRLS